MISLQDCIITKNNNGSISYNRYVHPSMLSLIEEFKNLYSNYPVIYPSGVCAIDSSIQCLMIENEWKPVHLIYGSELYCDSPRAFKYLEKMFPLLVKLHKVDITDEEQIKNLVKECSSTEERIFFYFETCSNPNGHIFNFELLQELKNITSNMRVIVDNTWITSALFNPFQFIEVDVVVNSLTKYYGGGNSGILGISISRTEELGNILFDYARIKGLHVSPIYCEAVLENMKNMKSRIKYSSELTLNVVRKLRENNIEVIYPKLEDHSSYTKANKYFGDLGPSVFTFIIPEKKALALKIMRNTNYECSTSFGCSTSRFDQWPISKKKRSTCRFSVGYEDNLDDIVNEFRKII